MKFMRLAAFATAAVVGFASTATATVIATFDIDGGYEIETPTPGGPSTFDVKGTFAGELLAPIPMGAQDYIFSADIVLNSVTIASGGLPITADLGAVIPDLTALVGDIIAGAGSTIPTPSGGTLVYGGALDSGSTPSDFSGTYFIDVDTPGPIGDAVDFALESLLGPIPFSFPNNNSGDFSISLSVSAVPLPAALPMLLFAVGGLGIAARKSRKPA